MEILFFIGGGLALIGAIMALIGAIMILIDAFGSDVVQGILCLLVPFYNIYYLFAKYSKDNKKTVTILLLGGVAVVIVGVILQTVGGIGVASEQGMFDELKKMQNEMK